MHRHPRMTTIVLALAGVAKLLGPLPVLAAATCEKQVDAVTAKYAKSVLGRAIAACRKSPGGTCFNVSVTAPPSKKLKKCDSTPGAIQALFNGHCPSRDQSCAPSAMTTAANVATCLACSIKSEVACLTATTFATASVPAVCAAFPSGAFLDPDPR